MDSLFTFIKTADLAPPKVQGMAHGFVNDWDHATLAQSLYTITGLVSEV